MASLEELNVAGPSGSSSKPKLKPRTEAQRARNRENMRKIRSDPAYVAREKAQKKVYTRRPNVKARLSMYEYQRWRNPVTRLRKSQTQKASYGRWKAQGETSSFYYKGKASRAAPSRQDAQQGASTSATASSSAALPKGQASGPPSTSGPPQHPSMEPGSSSGGSLFDIIRPFVPPSELLPPPPALPGLPVLAPPPAAPLPFPPPPPPPPGPGPVTPSDQAFLEIARKVLLEESP